MVPRNGNRDGHRCLCVDGLHDLEVRQMSDEEEPGDPRTEMFLKLADAGARYIEISAGHRQKAIDADEGSHRPKS